MPPKEEAASDSETKEVDFSFINVNYQGKTVEVAFPSPQAKAMGVVACENGHPIIPDATTGAISCGCGSTVKGDFEDA